MNEREAEAWKRKLTSKCAEGQKQEWTLSAMELRTLADLAEHDHHLARHYLIVFAHAAEQCKDISEVQQENKDLMFVAWGDEDEPDSSGNDGTVEAV